MSAFVSSAASAAQSAWARDAVAAGDVRPADAGEAYLDSGATQQIARHDGLRFFKTGSKDEDV